MEQNDSRDLSKFSTVEKLEKFLANEEIRRCERGRTFEAFEEELGGLMRDVECEVKAAELQTYDVNCDRVLVDGKEWRRCLTDEPKTYLSSSGPIQVERSLFRATDGSGKSICPLELRAGMVGERFTPVLARQVSFAVGHMTPHDVEQLFREFGINGPSRSSCDRLPKVIGEQWEEHREQWEMALRLQETIPWEATVLGVSLDGVMVPDKEAQQEAKSKRKEAAEQGKPTQGGPAGYKEVGCGTLTLYDGDNDGERMLTVRYARAPEYKKETLTSELDAELEAIVAARQDLVLVALADGAEENWRYFQGPLWEDATKIVDIGHGCEHLKAALNAYYGKDTVEGRAEYERLKTLLRDKKGGVDDVIKELKRLERKLPGRAAKHRRKTLKKERKYFENQKERMDYARYQALGLPIGSGIVEAACKTLVTERMKRSGMSWGSGTQTILTIRSLQQSDRWSRAWRLIAPSFRKDVFIQRQQGHLVSYTDADLAA